MGLYSDYTAAYGEDSGATIPNIEWVLKTLDVDNSKSGGELDTKLAEIDSKITEGLITKAPVNAALADAAESDILPAATSTAITTLLQTIRNNLKWLFNNKENLSNKKTSLTDNDTDFPTTKAVKTVIDTKANKTDALTLDSVFTAIYPIGSIYMTTNSANPSTYFKNTTWSAWGSGRVPVGIDTSDSDFNSVEETGGSKEIPYHNHTVSGNISNNGSHQHGIDSQTWTLAFRKMNGESDEPGVTSSIFDIRNSVNITTGKLTTTYNFVGLELVLRKD